jgi:hypothetical protein
MIIFIRIPHKNESRLTWHSGSIGTLSVFMEKRTELRRHLDSFRSFMDIFDDDVKSGKAKLYCLEFDDKIVRTDSKV